jgi:hypothetical protein
MAVEAQQVEAQQAGLDERIYGSWIRIKSGFKVEFRRDGTVYFRTDETVSGFIQRCSDAPLCIVTSRYGTGKFTYSFGDSDRMGLRYTSGVSEWNILDGTFLREVR